MSTDRTARYVIAAALMRRHEELSGEASPIDFDGAGQILKALEESHYAIVRRTPLEDERGRPKRSAAVVVEGGQSS